MDWSIQDIARIAGTTSRTLRHYDGIGLLKPGRTGHNGYRYYNQAAPVQLQRILLLRGLGLGLPVISQVLDDETDAANALTGHLAWLKQEQDRLARHEHRRKGGVEELRRGGGCRLRPGCPEDLRGGEPVARQGEACPPIDLGGD
ncbi:MerR family transcriptional regulator [Pseudarthrobacter sp. NBSH8]|nr:MerR family transcriptional regulator [Pseudarthrobacter sp. NBSH8]